MFKSFYSVLSCNDGFRFHWKSVWQTKVSLKVAFFAWLAALRKIFTMDNLRKRYVIVVDRCCMCKGNGESMNRLLLHCEVASAVWNVFFSWFGLSWVMPRRVDDTCACWWTAGRTRSLVVWKMMPFVVPLEGNKWHVLRTVRGHCRKLSRYSSILYIFERLLLFIYLFFLFWWLVIMIFLFFLLLLARCYLLYTYVYMGHLTLLMIFFDK